MKQLLLVSALLLPVFGLAQSIRGRVANERNQPLEFSTVILWKDSVIIKSMAIGKDGTYRFNDLSVNIKYRLAVSCVGYNNYDTTFLLTGDFNIQTVLSPQISELKEATVESSHKLIERKIDRLIFNVENNVNLIGSDATDILGKTPLVRVNGDAISLVGKGSVSIMLDGRILHLAGEALTAFLKTLKAETISKIEVITNPPAQYDAEGNGGLINIVMKKSRVPGFLASVTYNYSAATYDASYAGLNLNYNYKGIRSFGSIYLGKGSHAPTDQVDIYYNSQTWSRNDQQREYSNFYRGSFGFEADLSKNTSIGLSFNGGDSKPNLSANDHTTIADKVSNAIDSFLVFNNFYWKNYLTNTANAHFFHKFDTSGKELTVDADYYGISFDNDGTLNNTNYFADGKMTPNSTTSFQSDYDQQSLGYSLNGSFKLPIKSSTLTFGGKYSSTTNNSNVFLYDLLNGSHTLDSLNSNQFRYREDMQAIFATYNVSYKKWEAELGLRAEDVETIDSTIGATGTDKRSYFGIFPTFYLKYELNGANTFGFNYGRRIDRPNYSSFDPSKVYLNAYSYYLGNVNLQPSYEDNFELSHTYKNIFNTTLSFSHESRAITSLPVLTNGSNQQVTVIGNFLTSNNVSLDESINFVSLKWLQSLDEFDVYYSASSYNTNFSPVSFQLSNIKGFGGDLRSINSFYFNHSKTFVGGVNFNYVFPNVTGIYNFNRYYYLDLSLSRFLLDRKLRISVEARDIFKTKNVASATYINQVENLSTANNDSRRLVLNIFYSFGNSKLRKGTGHSESGDERGRSSQ